MTTTDLGALVAEARAVARRGERARARALADQVVAALADAPAPYALQVSLAALWHHLGEPARAAATMQAALAACPPDEPPAIVGTHHLFVAQALHRAGAWAQAAEHARTGLALRFAGDTTTSAAHRRAVEADVAVILRDADRADDDV